MNNGKEEIRKNILSLRNSISTNEVNNMSESIINKIYDLNVYKNSTVIMCYIDFKNEVKTEKFIRKSLHLGKKVAVPRIITYDNEKYIQAIFISNMINDLERNSYGILEPKSYLDDEVSSCNIELAIVPGIAFDENHNRIGFGKGFYDKFFSTNKSKS